MTTKRRFATRAEIFAMSSHLSEHCRSEEVDGVRYAVYETGWDDDRIAKTVSPELNFNHSKIIREEVFGKLMPASRSTDVDGVRAELNETRSELKTLELKFNALCDSLSLNRVLDCRKLKMVGGA